jgi:hypothetical protein
MNGEKWRGRVQPYWSQGRESGIDRGYGEDNAAELLEAVANFRGWRRASIEEVV